MTHRIGLYDPKPYVTGLHRDSAAYGAEVPFYCPLAADLRVVFGPGLIVLASLRVCEHTYAYGSSTDRLLILPYIAAYIGRVGAEHAYFTLHSDYSGRAFTAAMLASLDDEPVPYRPSCLRLRPDNDLHA